MWCCRVMPNWCLSQLNRLCGRVRLLTSCMPLPIYRSIEQAERIDPLGRNLPAAPPRRSRHSNTVTTIARIEFRHPCRPLSQPAGGIGLITKWASKISSINLKSTAGSSDHDQLARLVRTSLRGAPFIPRHGFTIIRCRSAPQADGRFVASCPYAKRGPDTRYGASGPLGVIRTPPLS